MKKQAVRYVLTVGVLLWAGVTLTKAQEQTLPTDCYTHGLVDLRTCRVYPWFIPESELVAGYYGVLGSRVPGLPPYRLDTFAPGNYLTGNATYMEIGMMPGIFLEEIHQRQLNAADYIGGIALDSCGYMGHSAWIRLQGGGDWIGPLLVSDCASFIHKYERVCYMGTVAELGYELYSLFQERGRLNNLEVYIQFPGDLSPPPAQLDLAPVAYAPLWRQESGLTC